MICSVRSVVRKASREPLASPIPLGRARTLKAEIIIGSPKADFYHQIGTIGFMLFIHIKFDLVANNAKMYVTFQISSSCWKIGISGQYWAYYWSFSIVGVACAQSLQSCLTPSDPMGCSLPISFVYGIILARILEWVAISYSIELYNALQILPALSIVPESLPIPPVSLTQKLRVMCYSTLGGHICLISMIGLAPIGIWACQPWPPKEKFIVCKVYST